MKVATLFLATALGSASLVLAQNSTMEAEPASTSTENDLMIKDWHEKIKTWEQITCDCSKPFQVDAGWPADCPDGYILESTDPLTGLSAWGGICIQIACSFKDKAKCKAELASTSTENDKSSEAKPAAATSDCQAPPQL